MHLITIHYYLQQITKLQLVLNSFWRYNIYWLLWLCLISYLSNSPSSGIPTVSFLLFEGADKIVHAVFYFTLMILLSWGLRKQHYFFKLNHNSLLFSFLFCLFWGGLMELSQLFLFTYRSAEWADFLANTIGATFALLLRKFILNKLKIA